MHKSASEWYLTAAWQVSQDTTTGTADTRVYILALRMLCIPIITGKQCLQEQLGLCQLWTHLQEEGLLLSMI